MVGIAYKFMLLLLPLPLLIRKLAGRKRKNHRALKVPFYKDLETVKVKNGSLKRNSFRMNFLEILVWSIWILVVISASRLQHIGSPIHYESERRIIMLSVDASGSMLERDYTMNGKRIPRFDATKKIIQNFIRKRTGDKIGVVLFATYPYLYAPPTTDLKTLSLMVDEMEVGIAGEKTAIGDGLGMAIKAIKDSPSPQKVIIILSDGISNAGDLSDQEATELAKSYGIKVYAIGIAGTDPYASVNFPFKIKLNTIDEESLRNMAQLTGGEYYYAEDSEDLENIYDRINEIEPVREEAETIYPTREIFYIPLSLAFILSIILFLATVKGEK